MRPTTAPPITAQVELYENERRWVGGGFSKKGLLPTDPGPFSTEDRSIAWKTLEEAGPAVLGKGWVWEDGSEYVYDVPDSDGVICDSEGWRYAVDFAPNHLQNASSRQGMAHFVRRRRICRRKTFDPDQLAAYDKCKYCDSNAVDTLSSKLLEALAVATLHRRNEQHSLADGVAVPLKAKLIDSLGIGSPLSEWDEKVEPSSRLCVLQEELYKFGDSQQNVLLKASHIFQKRTEPPSGLSDRMEQIDEKYFGREEREAISCIIVRQLDPECELHCGRESCGEDCDFFRLVCPNNGCGRRISRKHMARHDEMCEFKVILCPKGCGDSVPRNRLQVHLADVCCLRDVNCPFQSIGCSAVMKANETSGHVEENMHSHLLLAATRMSEYQIHFKKMGRRVEQLEMENAELRRVVSTNMEKLDKGVVGVEKDVKAVSRKLSALEKRCNSEFRSHVK